ncbi:HAD-IA family hydrolase [Diaphorobacter sp. HDW4A]|uniref:HAD family hydrolase n=1 Tax=Diaphorobacter sp. HDW4A TaxID=2714924 RepID=UPI0014090A69|nr:HAD-IA family hydrolase [Diaphorobacter sp. HDW4A]QIL79567.1 HAD-IA family hydrolase [Diaphorobacter sp. HDW4A]
MHELDISRIKAITIDLDDTLWPVWPTITRAEEVLAEWLRQHAPATSAAYPDSRSLRRIRERVELERPELRFDLSAMRRESIRAALTECGDDPALAEPAFDLFFDERQRVVLFDDALETLEFLAARYPVVAISNGNADVNRIGLGRYFKAALSAQGFGIAKPDVRIFQAGAEQAGYSSEAVLHVGDDARLDVEGALLAGMQTAWVNWDNKTWELEAQPHVMLSKLGELCSILR